MTEGKAVAEQKEAADISGGAIGTVGKYDVAFTNGQLVVEVDANVGASSAGLVIKVDSKQVIDAIAAAVSAKTGSALPTEIATFLEAALLKL